MVQPGDGRPVLCRYKHAAAGPAEGKEGIHSDVDFQRDGGQRRWLRTDAKMHLSKFGGDKDGSVYSGVNDPGFDTTGQTWLRGAQTTDANGNVTFKTIFSWLVFEPLHTHPF